MIRDKINWGRTRCVAIVLTLVVAVLGVAATGFCAQVDFETARQVAEAKMHRHVALFGSWNGAATPVIADQQAISHDGVVVAYDFKVKPGGHILVAVDDDLAPIPLYSASSDFKPDAIDDPNAIESWIVPELSGKLTSVQENRRRAAAGSSGLSTSSGRSRIKAAWSYFKTPPAADGQPSALTRSASAGDGAASDAVRGIVLDAMVTTNWDQIYPYSLQTPEQNCSSAGMATDNTLTGCVATAWAQVLRYYQWPDAGAAADLGSHSYIWNNQVISADFGDTQGYDWANMPNLTSDIDTVAERNAVAWLMQYAGVAAETDYGCTVSSSEIWANDALDVFFRYKAMELYQKGVTSLPGSKTWFQMFKSELDAGRLVIFTIYSSIGGHEVVVDGYQDDTTEMVHINFGWSGTYDEFYDITDAADFKTGTVGWDPNAQYIVVGIEPNRNSELPQVTITSGDQTVDENSSVQLTGVASHSSLAIASYQWLNVGKPGTQKVTSFTNGNTSEASFTAPAVSQDTDYVFMLKAVDAQRGVGYAQCTITVRNIGNDTPTSVQPPMSSSRSSSGGCFIDALTGL